MKTLEKNNSREITAWRNVHDITALLYSAANSESAVELKSKILEHLRLHLDFNIAWWRDSCESDIGGSWYRYCDINQCFVRQSSVEPLPMDASGTIPQLLKSSFDNIHLEILLFLKRRCAIVPKRLPSISQTACFYAENIARSYLLFLSLQMKQTWRNAGSEKGILSRDGKLIVATKDFAKEANGCFPNWVEILPRQYSETAAPQYLVQTRKILAIHWVDELVYFELLDNNEFSQGLMLLTPVELQVCYGLTQGMCAQQIANVKKLSVKTVDNQIHSVHKKLGYSRNSELISWLMASGLELSFFASLKC